MNCVKYVQNLITEMFLKNDKSDKNDTTRLDKFRDNFNLIEVDKQIINDKYIKSCRGVVYPYSLHMKTLDISESDAKELGIYYYTTTEGVVYIEIYRHGKDFKFHEFVSDEIKNELFDYVDALYEQNQKSNVEKQKRIADIYKNLK